MEEQTEQNQSQTESKATLELLDFWAVWCGPCRIMEPILNQLEEDYKDKMVIRKLNVDESENQSLMQQYNVMSVPTYIILKNGEAVGSFIGVQPKATLVTKIEAALNG